MFRSTRTLLSCAAVAAVAVAGVIGWCVATSGTVVRYYMPGPLGRERIRATLQVGRLAGSKLTNGDTAGGTPAATSAGFITRAIGLRPGEEQEWGERNGITPALAFSHHLAAVFPPALYKTHPEFFPLIEGKRFEPGPKSVNWNPDLARGDVARHAADVAIAAFRRDPSALSFSLGINDSVVYGDGEEARRLLRKAETLKRWNAEMGATDTGGTPVATQARGSAATARNAVPGERDSQPRLKSEATDTRGTAGTTARGSAALRDSELQVGRLTGSTLQKPNSAGGMPGPTVARASAVLRDSERPVRWFRGRPDLSPVVFAFMNRAAAIVAQEFPDKYLGCLAYYWCENAPPFPVDPHVIPFLCADRSQFYDPAFRREEFLLQERWGETLRAGNAETLKRWNAEMESPKQPKERAGKAVPSDSDSLLMLYRANATVCQTEKLKSDHRTSTPVLSSGNTASSISEFSPKLKRSFRQSEVRRRGSEVENFSVSAFQRFNISSEAPPRRLGLYDYLDGYGYLVPRVPIHAFAENLKHAHEVGFTDYYGESSRNWGLDGPLPWVIAQLLQDPEQPLEPLLDEYYTQYFHEAAGPMRRFFDRCEEQWMRQQGPSYWLKYYRSQSQADLFPSPVCSELRRLLDEAAAQARSERVRQRVAFVSDAFGLTERFVAFEESRDALARAVLAGAELQVGKLDGSKLGRPEAGSQKPEAGSQMPEPGTGAAEARASAALLQPTADGRGQTAASDLSSDVRRLTSGSSDLAAKLAEYRRRRLAFIRYGFELAGREPLAFHPINYADWLRDDPTYAAEVAVGGSLRPEAGSQKPEGGRQKPEDGSQKPEGGAAETSEGRSSFAEPMADRRQMAESELSSDVRHPPSGSSAQRTPLSFTGPLRPGLRMLGVAYGIDLPAPWLSSVEPREGGVAALRGANSKPELQVRKLAGSKFGEPHSGKPEAGSQRMDPQTRSDHDAQLPTPNSRTTPSAASPTAYVHLSGQELATFYQWRRAEPGKFYAVSARVRGRVRSADAEMITLGWLDAQQRPIGTSVAMRLPTGTWPDWVTLRQGQCAPANAAWVGVAFYSQHQVADDFVDVGDVVLEEQGHQPHLPPDQRDGHEKAQRDTKS